MPTFDQRGVIQFDPNALPLYRATYAASTNGNVLTATAAGTVTSLAYLFHPSANTKHVEILQISITTEGNPGNANGLTFRGARITAENGTPGGTSQSINPFDTSDPASTLIFRTGATGAPTRVAGDMISVASNSGTQILPQPLLDSGLNGKPIVLRAGQSEGFEIRSVIGGANLSAAVSVSITFIWTEITP